MAWDGEEFSRRLERLSYDTMFLISEILGTDKRKAVTRIIMENDTEEAEKKIQELLSGEK